MNNKVLCAIDLCVESNELLREEEVRQGDSDLGTIQCGVQARGHKQEAQAQAEEAQARGTIQRGVQARDTSTSRRGTSKRPHGLLAGLRHAKCKAIALKLTAIQTNAMLGSTRMAL